MDEDEAKFTMFLVCLALAVGMVFGWAFTRAAYRTESVEKGYAEWTVATNGVATWAWKETKK